METAQMHTGNGHAHAHAHAHGDHDKNEPKVYGAVLGALLFLTIVTVAASKVQFGSGMVNVVVALTIATIKASLVALFFMHLRHDPPINAVILLTSFAFLALFVGYCYIDFATRDPLLPSNLKVTDASSVAPTTGQVAPAGGAATPATAGH